MNLRKVLFGACLAAPIILSWFVLEQHAERRAHLKALFTIESRLSYSEQAGEDECSSLPIEFSERLLARIREVEGADIRMVSAWPFKNGTANRGPRDGWESNAIQRLEDNPAAVVFKRSFSHVTIGEAEVMGSSCVNCHNEHPDSPKTDWRVGDMRSMVVVKAPIFTARAWPVAALAGVSSLMVFFGGTLVSSGRKEVERRRRKEREDTAEIELPGKDDSQQLDVASLLGDDDELYRQRFVQSPLAEVLIDKDDKIVDASNHLARLFGYSRDELQAMKVTQLIPADKRSKHASLAPLFIQKHSPIQDKITEVTVEGLHRDGSTFPVRLAISTIAVRDLSKKILYGAGSLRRVE